MECIALMNRDVAEFEKKYQGKFAEPPHVGLGNRKTRCVNEATLPIITCDPSCIEKCASTCYVLRICTIPHPSCRKCEAKNTVLRRIDPKAYYEHFYREAERLHLPIRLSDGGDFENAEQGKLASRRQVGILPSTPFFIRSVSNCFLCLSTILQTFMSAIPDGKAILKAKPMPGRSALTLRMWFRMAPGIVRTRNHLLNL